MRRTPGERRRELAEELELVAQPALMAVCLAAFASAKAAEASPGREAELVLPCELEPWVVGATVELWESAVSRSVA
jgi:hypothetical protein